MGLCIPADKLAEKCAAVGEWCLWKALGWFCVSQSYNMPTVESEIQWNSINLQTILNRTGNLSRKRITPVPYSWVHGKLQASLQAQWSICVPSDKNQFGQGGQMGPDWQPGHMHCQRLYGEIVNKGQREDKLYRKLTSAVHTVRSIWLLLCAFYPALEGAIVCILSASFVTILTS